MQLEYASPAQKARGADHSRLAEMVFWHFFSVSIILLQAARPAQSLARIKADPQQGRPWIRPGRSDNSVGLRTNNGPHRRNLLSQADCKALMEPKVQQAAMLWLIKEEIHQESVWTDWLRLIAGTIHKDIQCDDGLRQCYMDHVLTTPPRSVYDEQGWFTFYVHSKPGALDFQEGSIFAGRTIEQRIQTEWGTHSLTQATRLLLKAALANPLNQRFSLLCGSSLPIRPPLFVYTQLVGEPRSRFGVQQGHFIHAKHDQANEMSESWFRFPLPMHEEWPELKDVWVMHNQFWTLNRKHASIINDDVFVDDVFSRHCHHNVLWEPTFRSWCISDEQYVGTALSSVLGKAFLEELVIDPALLHIKAQGGLQPEEITPDLILRARNVVETNFTELEPSGAGPGWSGDRTERCHGSETPQVHVVRLYDGHLGDCEYVPIDALLPDKIVTYPHCPLFARKFKAEAREKAAEVLDQLRIVMKSS